MALSNEGLQIIHSTKIGRGLIPLLFLNNADFPEGLFISNDPMEIVIDNNKYVYYPFDIQLPSETDTTNISAVISIDNIDQQLWKTIDLINTEIDCVIRLVSRNNPSYVEVEYSGYKLRNIKTTRGTIQGSVVLDTLENEYYSKYLITPNTCPGSF